MWRVGRSPGEKAVGASTNAKKINPPSQTTSDNSMRNRRNDMSEIIECWDLYRELADTTRASAVKFRSIRPLIHSPNQRCHLLPCAQLFTLILPHCPEGIIKMQRSLTATDVNFVSLQSAIFCVQCELLSENNTPRCLACGSGAVLSLSRVLGGSLRGQQTAHLIADAELDRLVRSLLYT